MTSWQAHEALKFQKRKFQIPKKNKKEASLGEIKLRLRLGNLTQTKHSNQ